MHGSLKNSTLGKDIVDPMRPAILARPREESWGSALRFALLALLIGQISLMIQPWGFEGGLADDQRYVDVALQWLRDGPSAGTTHWALRLPLIGAIDLAFRISGPSVEALLAVPRLFHGLFLMVAGAAMMRWAGPRAAWLWLALAVTSPVLHDMGTSAFPEIIELAMGATSLVAFLAARRSARPLHRHGWMIMSGLALGIGVITRETLAFLAVGYAWAAIFRPAGTRGVYATLACAIAAVPLANILWLWVLTGDPLYRLHVNQNHIHIFSAHLKGGVYTGGSPFLNPDLASRWLPSGPTRLFWPINPLIDFLIGPRFGFVILGCVLVALPWLRRGAPLRLPRGAAWMLLAIAFGSYLTVTWVFTLRPQPRYYLLIAAAAQVGLAMGLAAMFARPDLRRRAALVLGFVLLGGAIPILVTRDRGSFGAAGVAYMVANHGTYAAVAKEEVGQLAWRARLAGLAPPGSGSPPVGGYRLSAVDSRSVGQEGGRMVRDPAYRQVALIRLKQPALEQLARPQLWRALRVEQRLY